MKSSRIQTAILIFAISSLSFGQENVRSILQLKYDKITQLATKRDKRNLERVTRKNAASNFEYIDAMQNSLDLAATIRQNSEQLSRVYKFHANSNRITAIKNLGSRIVCTVKSDYDVITDPSEKNRIKGVSISEDSWTITMSGWKLKRSKIVKESSTMNGKPLH